MKSYSRIISLLLALIMSLSLMTATFASSGDYDVTDDTDIAADEFVPEDDLALTTNFKDVKTTAWYYNDVTECAKLGIVQGFTDGTFKPEDKVTGIQFVVMMTRTFYNDSVEAYKKTETSSWYAPNIAAAKSLSWSMLYNLTIKDKAMSRYDMAMALYNTLCNENKVSSITSAQLTEAQNSIKDYKSIPSNRAMLPSSLL